MELSKVIEKRRSIRNFSNKKASWKDVIEAIDAAMQAPFAGNTNNLRFLIIESPETISMLAEKAEQDWIQDASIVILVCTNHEQLTRLYEERGLEYSQQQTGAAIQNFLLTATDRGLAACWIGAFDEEAIKSRLGVSGSYKIEALIPVGYENAKQPAKKIHKKSFSTSIYWEKWGERKRPTIFKESSKHMTPILSKK